MREICVRFRGDFAIRPNQGTGKASSSALMAPGRVRLRNQVYLPVKTHRRKKIPLSNCFFIVS